ncbi:hypothetical protein MKW92_033129 [Papaver armeniacum]|nr:hypothetical protein MKW92_033129 [Papaver armeniacum]
MSSRGIYMGMYEMKEGPLVTLNHSNYETGGDRMLGEGINEFDKAFMVMVTSSLLVVEVVWTETVNFNCLARSFPLDDLLLESMKKTASLNYGYLFSLH